MNPDTEIQTELPPFLRIYKSGRVERLAGTATVPAGPDPTTGVTSKDVTINPSVPISARLFLPASYRIKNLPILIYYHGGGFCVESPFSPLYHLFCNNLASRAGLLIVSVDYRLAPERPLPAAYDDSWAALKWALSPGSDPWLAQHGDLSRVFVAGDSAGANIAHHMAMRAGAAAEEETGGVPINIEGMVLLHPFFWGTEPVGPETREAKTRAWVEAVWKMANANADGVEADNVRINVTAKDAPGLEGLGGRKVMVAVAEKDVLVERGRSYGKALEESKWGGEVEIVESDGEGHVFYLGRPECDKALELMDKLAAFFKIQVA